MKKGKVKGFKIRRYALAIMSVLLCAVLTLSADIFYRFNCDKSGTDHSYSEIYEQKQTVLTADESGIFRILKINDTHFFNGTCKNDVKTLNGIRGVLEDDSYDLIVVDGDLVDGFNIKPGYNKFGAIDIFAKMLEEYSTPWTFAPGNNDGEMDGSNEAVIAFMMQYDHFLCGNSRDTDGAMQLFIDIEYNGELAHSVAVLDSGSRVVKAIGHYDYMKPSQAQWLLDGVEARGVKTSVFYHITTNAFQVACDRGEKYGSFFFSSKYPYGGIEHNATFDIMTAGVDNISLLSCAHQHSNNMCSFYNNRYYLMSSVSGYSASHDSYITPSVTEIEVNLTDPNTKTMYTFNQIKY